MRNPRYQGYGRFVRKSSGDVQRTNLQLCTPPKAPIYPSSLSKRRLRPSARLPKHMYIIHASSYSVLRFCSSKPSGVSHQTTESQREDLSCWLCFRFGQVEYSWQEGWIGGIDLSLSGVQICTPNSLAPWMISEDEMHWYRTIQHLLVHRRMRQTVPTYIRLEGSTFVHGDAFIV